MLMQQMLFIKRIEDKCHQLCIINNSIVHFDIYTICDKSNDILLLIHVCYIKMLNHSKHEFDFRLKKPVTI